MRKVEHHYTITVTMHLSTIRCGRQEIF
eukprot:CCRYP_009540-RA/>CCRYP_009540-RA protein AED:0.46 eAED:0.46 QI:10/1/1/1/0/0/2/115/27